MHRLLSSSRTSHEPSDVADMKLRSGFVHDRTWPWAIVPVVRVNLLLFEGGEPAESSDLSVEMWTEDGDDVQVYPDGATSRRMAPPLSPRKPHQDVV
ncbi:Os08g0304800 [Oryza sativa Japonica Group]|uniref:Os08g0304800 protein n=4 Tax=Oryza TaxID=4527 RepID=A0A0P0XEL5_ORYSJ|nr:Os08g0304800 [Oryza sativa Japonica Group]